MPEDFPDVDLATSFPSLFQELLKAAESHIDDLIDTDSHCNDIGRWHTTTLDLANAITAITEHDYGQPLDAEAMRELRVGEGWEDGREGFVYCRFDAVIDKEKMIRAEVVWLDDEDHDGDGEVTQYFRPSLRIESNRPSADSPDVWEIVDEAIFSLTMQEAVDLVDNPATDILTAYAERIAKLKLHTAVSQEPPTRQFVIVHPDGGVGALSAKDAGKLVDMQDCHEAFTLMYNDGGTLYPVTFGNLNRIDPLENGGIYGYSDMIANDKRVGTVDHTDH